MRTTFVTLIAMAGALTACATPTTTRPTVSAANLQDEAKAQAQYALRTRLAEEERLQHVALKLFKANADKCPAKRNGLGVNFANFYSFDSKFRSAARDGLGLAEAPQATFVWTGGAADLAGLTVGDVVTAVQGVAIKTGPAAMGDLSRKLKDALAAGDSVRLTVSGPAGERVLAMKGEPYCAYEVRLDDSSDINAFADGEAIIVTRGMLRLASTEQELALVVGHELAHNSEGHIGSKRKNATAGMVGGMALDLLLAAGGVNTQGAFGKAGAQAGAGYASAAFESEADYVGLYYMARAQYETKGAADFWRKMSVEAPRSIFMTTSHPTNPDRNLGITAADKEIDERVKAGLPLSPHRKAAD